MKKLLQGLLAVIALATSVTTYAASKGNVLVLLSSETALPLQEGKSYASGFYLNEFGVPADALLKAGYSLTIVTPKGNKPLPDEHSIDPMYFANNPQEMQRIKSVVDTLTAEGNVKSLKQVLAQGTESYAGIFIPGGHAPLIDLPGNADVGALLRQFHRSGKPTAAICHGPIALLAAQEQPQTFEQGLIAGAPAAAKNWIYAGYKMTIFSDAEEQAFEMSLKGAKLRYYPAQAMAQAGGKMAFANAWQANVVTDRELITGQNPFSDHALAKTLIAALDSKKR
ncbi:type 1 glutamine amidotransferase domain-containing protein [Kosakonia sp. MH5]|uniref:type 1 glutamine amidotransferase domain-containing protein n=1 Tax=Kosakonia sp. MH5 TaxID=2202822 RepID=UPI001374EF7D|nr:type 1 glutamine amidotransferase domain-containing protein [Kosakonia sp. MH5]NCF03913.1 type 1 glutamine amidotransferase domain-containing protein [Kosakonia sp. MH5]